MLDNRHKTRLSYADLLDLYLQQKSAGIDANLDTIARSIGFKYTKQTSGKGNKEETGNDHHQVSGHTGNAVDSLPATTTGDRPKLPFYYIAKRERVEGQTASHADEQPALMHVKPLDDDNIYDENAPAPPWQALTRQPKLWAKLRQVLKQQYDSQEPDICKLLNNIERGDSPQKVPFAKKNRRSSQLLVLADYSDHLRTARQDYRQLRKDLEDYWGKDRISWQTMLGHPGGNVRIHQKKHYKTKKWALPPTDTAILILSDCGCYAETEHHQQWQIFLEEIRRSGNIALVLAPVAPGDLVNTQLKQLHAYSWDSTLPRVNNAYSQTGQAISTKVYKDIEKILTLLGFTYWIEPHLLRATRQLLNLDVGCEAICRMHEDVTDDGKYLTIKKQALKKYRKKFAQLETQLQDQVIELVKASHAHLPRSILDYELVTVQALRPDQPVAGADESLHFLQRLCKTFMENPHDELLQSHVYTTLEEQERGGEEAASMFVTLHNEEIEKGEINDLKPPKNVTLDDIARFIDIRQSGTAYTLAQKQDKIILYSKTGNEAGYISYPFKLTKTVFTYRMIELQSGMARIGDSSTLPLPPPRQVQTINTGTENLTIGTITKPLWADNIGRDQQGLFIECDHLGQQLRVYYPEWGGGLGKDEYGIYHELEIQGVVQRFRYIPAGRFVMGSPNNEKDRYDDETQHEVVLTQSFWLADTACTQELWQAVMGDNPSRFNKDIQNPVEKVSWDDVQKFLKKLNTGVPKLSAELPSEAQWEYACRAGTITPFSFGENITPEQVNFNGNYPYAGGKKGLYREKTIPVKALAANQWGLYQMHGNIWEWCPDWYGKYPEGSVQDPTGVPSREGRVLRGGSWINFGQFVRSADRYRNTPVNRNSRIGFRFSLGQASGEAVAENKEIKVKFSEQRVARAGAARNVASGFVEKGINTIQDFVKRKK